MKAGRFDQTTRRRSGKEEARRRTGSGPPEKPARRRAIRYCHPIRHRRAVCPVVARAAHHNSARGFGLYEHEFRRLDGLRLVHGGRPSALPRTRRPRPQRPRLLTRQRRNRARWRGGPLFQRLRQSCFQARPERPDCSGVGGDLPAKHVAAGQPATQSRPIPGRLRPTKHPAPTPVGLRGQRPDPHPHLRPGRIAGHRRAAFLAGAYAFFHRSPPGRFQWPGRNRLQLSQSRRSGPARHGPLPRPRHDQPNLKQPR